DYSILVYDNLGDGKDRAYLQAMRDAGRIELIENDGWTRRPGESMTELAKTCTTRYACFLESDCEIIDGGWLALMMGLIARHPRTVGVGRYFAPGPHGVTFYAPVWGPECLLIDMDLYRPIVEPNDWQQRSIPTELYPHARIFAGMRPPDGYNGTVNLDTCWRFTEKVEFETERGFRVEPLPLTFFATHVRHYGGISTRGTRPEIQPRWEAIRKRLGELRRAVA
ncbi:MAG: hypothetical protein IMZ71_01470, partial [Chloroflexi bacterium]|nr:hypothetical protein [Chloroflexota bacterium]